MKNNSKGITMVSLIITIMVMFIIAGTTVYTSLDRFKVNELSKMYNDIKLLSDKVSNYYLQYNGLPVIRDNSNNPIVYPVSSLNFDKNVNDNTNYYILDLKTMEGIVLNYGADGINNPTTSAKDIYVVNEASHVIYYVKGIETEGVLYHTLPNDENTIADNIPPSKPEIRVVSGTKNKSGTYTSEVEVEIIPGKDGWSGTNRTTYSINNGTETSITTLTNNIYKITTDGTYAIKAKSYDESNNASGEVTMQLIVNILKIGDKVEYDEGYSANKTNTVDTNFVMDDMDWRVLDVDKTNGTVKLISSRPTTSKLSLLGQQDWLDAETKLDTLCSQLYANGTGVTARSLKVEDIDKLANMLTAKARKAATSSYGTKWRYKYDATKKRIQYSKSEDNGTTWTEYADTSYKKFKDPRNPEINSSNYQDTEGNPIVAELDYTYYYYDMTSKITAKTADDIKVSDLIYKGLNKETGAVNSSGTDQWMASHCVYLEIIQAGFLGRIVNANGSVAGSRLWNSSGSSTTKPYAVRPIVLLNLEALTQKVNGVWQVQL